MWCLASLLLHGRRRSTSTSSHVLSSCFRFLAEDPWPPPCCKLLSWWGCYYGGVSRTEHEVDRHQEADRGQHRRGRRAIYPSFSYMLIRGEPARAISNTNTTAIGTLFFLELKKQASYFFKDKICTTRLALIYVTPTQLCALFRARRTFLPLVFGYLIRVVLVVASHRLVEEATNGSVWAPDTQLMGFISREAFELKSYWRIVRHVLHMRLTRFDRKHWREPYKGLILLEYLLTHGTESMAEEFHIDRNLIKELHRF